MNRVVLLAFILSAGSFGFCQSAIKPSAPASLQRFHIDCSAGPRADLEHLLAAPCIELNPRPVFAASIEIPPQPLVLHPKPPRGLEIPKQWPDLKMEKIPTQWPNLKLLPITEKPVAAGSSTK
jgi:hypothetical protein